MAAGIPSDGRVERPPIQESVLFSKKWPGSARGTSFALPHLMSPMALALRARFEEVCRAELVRLRRKTASLPPEQQAHVEAVSAHVTRALAASLEAGLDGQDQDLHEIVGRIFGIPASAPSAAAAVRDADN